MALEVVLAFMLPTANIEATFIAAVVMIFGLMIGSFLNVVIFRLPNDQSIVWPGSHCPKCDRALTAWENLPVLSWLALCGRCFGCKAPISWRYPAIELATGALFLFTYLQFGLTLQTFFLWVLIALLIVTFWIDIDHMVILDVITLPGAVLGLIYSAVVTGQFWFSLAALLGGVAILLFINSLTLLAIKQDGIGGGDFTLVAMMGAWLGISQTLLALGLAMVAGAVIGLLMLFGRWLRDRRWQPFALALGVAVPTALGLNALFAGSLGEPMPASLWGSGLSATLRLANVGIAAMLGACAGWLYMRARQDDGYLIMPFGPALVLGALGSLYWGIPLVEWYQRGVGTF